MAAVPPATLIGFSFNRPIEGVAWPESLRKLEFGSHFNQPIAQVKWSASLQDLSIGDDEPFQCEGFPLRRLMRLGTGFRQSLRGLGAWMPHLEDLTLLVVENYSIVVGIEWPKNLKRIKIFQHGASSGIVVPPTVELVLLSPDEGIRDH